MKIAIPLLKDRVSPYFGCCSKLLLVETDGSRVLRQVTWDVYGKDPWELARHLVQMGVKKVVCGGIWYYYRDWLDMHGVEVVDNGKGQVDEVVGRLLASRSPVG